MIKTIFLKTAIGGTLFLTLSVTSINVNAQVFGNAPTWSQSQIYTYTDGNVSIGDANPPANAGHLGGNLPSLNIKTYMINGDGGQYNNTSINIGNYRDPATTLTEENVIQIYGMDASGATAPIPFFILDGDGKVGINVQPDNSFSFPNNRTGFDFNVNGWSYFSDKVLIGDDITSSIDQSPYKLYVKGGILTDKVRVETHSQWPDYVFAEDYDLMSLNVLAKYVGDNKHLPGVPSASDVEDNGIELSEMSAVLLQKVEELTLYVIELKKENEELRKDVNAMKK